MALKSDFSTLQRAEIDFLAPQGEMGKWLTFGTSRPKSVFGVDKSIMLPRSELVALASVKISAHFNQFEGTFGGDEQPPIFDGFVTNPQDSACTLLSPIMYSRDFLITIHYKRFRFQDLLHLQNPTLEGPAVFRTGTNLKNLFRAFHSRVRIDRIAKNDPRESLSPRG